MSEGRLPRLGGLAVLSIAGACASEVPPATPSAPHPSPMPRERWSRYGELAGLSPVNESAFATRGHLVKPGYAVVRVSSEARESYLALVTDSLLPDRALVAMFHQSRDGAEKGPVYVMEKRASEWSFVALDAEGYPIGENLAVCALCHRGGVADHLFGLPRSLSGGAR
jgi:hypothetical protein